ncbi:MAG: 50S ribosomal protein L9 [bacterium]
MRVLLLQDVDHVGPRGELITVSDGFARNFLLPRKLAERATVGSEQVAARFKSSAEKRRGERRRQDEELAAKLGAVSCTLTRKAGDDEKLFGSVSGADVAEALKAQGFEVDRRYVVLEAPIKSLGVYTVPVRLAAGIEAAVKVWIVRG